MSCYSPSAAVRLERARKRLRDAEEDITRFDGAPGQERELAAARRRRASALYHLSCTETCSPWDPDPLQASKEYGVAL
jgi:hypothetical protein